METKKITIILITLIMLSLLTAEIQAATQEVSLKKLKEVELVFNGVTLDNILFYPKNDLITKYDKHENVKIESKGNKVYLSSEDEAKIKLWLPENKTYIYRFRKKDNDNVICKFNPDTLVVLLNGKKILTFKDKKYLIQDVDEDSTKIRINNKGIFVNNENEKVEISSKGIIVKGEDENVELTGFFGKLLGGFIKIIVKASISAVGDTPEKVAKHIINSDLKNENIEIEINGTEYYE
ncbi:MAG: hypothetical protein ISS28_00855 [Candidatus Cloacimonetes bacterium]|nr:hypothetical protein [Candidatus Cloacimonadota bacterium]MBL7085638.1 hypothetical protein [Candidatus Cloacimonadota bacterium]